MWPHRSYAPRRPSSPTTTRYFVDKMPWYQDGEDDRIWIAYVDAARTLQGFETFLDQYRALLASDAVGSDICGAHGVARRDPERVHQGA